MEYLYATLAECLEKYGVLPEVITYGILRDVALGLRYLHEHSPPIIHRDLSANNILLATDMSAKISDLGVAKILNLSPSQITLRITTQAPGTPCYMPPEALVSKPFYTSKIDSYSYGVLMIHVLCGEWPFPGDAFTEAPNAPGSFLPISEFDRRSEHLLKIGLDHPLMGLIKQCLSNAPASRPEASEILCKIEDLKSSLPPTFENKLEMIQQIQSRGEDTDGEKLPNQCPLNGNSDVSELRQLNKTLRDENEVQRNLIETLKKKTEAYQKDIESKTTEVESLKQQRESWGREVEAQKKKAQGLRRRNEILSRQIEAQQSEIESTMREVVYPSKLEIESKMAVQDPARQSGSQSLQIEEQIGEVQSLKREVQYLRQYSEPESREIEAKRNEIETTKTREVSSLNRDILPLTEQLKKLSTPLPSPSSTEPPPHFTFNPDTPVEWRRCADLPVAMKQHRLVPLKGMVYTGGGYSIVGDDHASRPEDFLVFQYDPRGDRWITLPPCPVRLFALGQFQGSLIAVGGVTHQGLPSKKVYHYREELQEWEEYVKPMPTARFCVSVIATSSAIIACGGEVDFGKSISTIEAYIAEAGKWHTVDPLPNAYSDMTSVTIDGICYLFGGHKSISATKLVLYVKLFSLIGPAISPPGKFAKAFKKAPWKTVPDTPLFFSTAASIGGRLVTIGGRNRTSQRSAATHMFVHTDNAWVRMPSGDLPTAVFSSAAIELSDMKLMVCGGWLNRGLSKETYIGSFAE